MTNYEKIKAMTVEEMAELIFDKLSYRNCELCPAKNTCDSRYSGCISTIGKYLESEVEENG